NYAMIEPKAKADRSHKTKRTYPPFCPRVTKMAATPHGHACPTRRLRAAESVRTRSLYVLRLSGIIIEAVNDGDRLLGHALKV
ncbi:MAG: hypothetical protein ACPGWR_34245, partial [Ardenticatenaceae bacterium]